MGDATGTCPLEKHVKADDSPESESQAGWSAASATPDPPTPADRRAHKIRGWRRRALLKHGARLHAEMGPKAQQCSLAMLDESGVVISWYSSADGNDHASQDVVDRHLSQFYVPEEIAKRWPSRDLKAATVEGSTTRRTWRRRPDGSTFSGTIVIEAMILRDGRLQGFSYLASTPEPS